MDLDVFYRYPYLIFIIHVPLIDSHQYDFYQIHSLPIPNPKNPNEYHTILPNYKFLLILNPRQAASGCIKR